MWSLKVKIVTWSSVELRYSEAWRPQVQAMLDKVLNYNTKSKGLGYNLAMEDLSILCNEDPGWILSVKKKNESLRKKRHAKIHHKKMEVAVSIPFWADFRARRALRNTQGMMYSCKIIEDIEPEMNMFLML